MTHFTIKQIIDFLDSKRIGCSFFGDQDRKICGLSHLNNPLQDTICYTDSKKTNDASFILANSKINNNVFICENPKLAFYYLSHLFYKKDFLLQKQSKNISNNIFVSNESFIYENVEISSGTVIGPNSTIGSYGISWTWDHINNKKVYLYSNGKVIIGKECVISSNNKIVRGLMSDDTIIQDNVFIAPGTAIGHATKIADNVHIANNCTIGGGVSIGSNSFLGCGSIISPNSKIGKNCIIASGACIKAGDIFGDNLVIAGIPAKIIKQNNDFCNFKGVPKK